MNLDLEIKPYRGVGELRFGMKPDEVSKIIGAPDKAVITKLYKDLREYRNESGFLATYAHLDNSLVELGFSPNILNLSYKDIKLFQSPHKDVLEYLINEDGNPFELYGFVVLLNLGITLTGFDEEDKSDRAVTVFVKGRWDSKKDKFCQFRLRT